jgi:ABC-type glycerol-3-phosphate transport system substrate-binding protein
MVVLAAASLAGMAVLSGCGGGFALTGPTQNYTVTVTAAGGGDQQTTTVQLNVQQ